MARDFALYEKLAVQLITIEAVLLVKGVRVISDDKILDSFSFHVDV